MTKYKSDIAESASSMMQLPDTLEGMLRDIHGQTEVTNKQVENKEGNLSITNYCCPIKPLYTAISSLNPAEIGMISSYFKFQAPLE